MVGRYGGLFKISENEEVVITCKNREVWSMR
jgi:hypothetical protein